MMDLKKKWKKIQSDFRKAKDKKDNKRMSQALAEAEKLEKQAKYDKALLSTYKRQAKARKTSQSLRQYKQKNNIGFGGVLSGLGDSVSGSSLGSGGFLPFESSGKKGKKKNDDYSIF